MSRYTIIVTGQGRPDPDAVIGYNPPLRTFFLQAFPDETGDHLALWLRTSDREYETVEALRAAALARGFDFMPLPEASRCCDIFGRSSRFDHEARAGRRAGAGLFFCRC